jgi:hypothetical protein
VKELYNEKFKTLMKEIEDKTNGKIYCVHGLEELIFYSVCTTKVTYRFSAFSIKIQHHSSYN